MPQQEKIGIVIGASLAGLFAARVMADHFDRVVVLERDTLRGDEPRRCLPQARHTHLIRSGGQRALETLFPGLTDRLGEAGAIVGDALRDIKRFVGGGYYCHAPSGLCSILMSRPLLDREICASVLARGNVEILENCYVESLVASPDRMRVTGVRATLRDEPGAASRFMAAELVIDATGCATRTPAWLTTNGYAAPEKETVDVLLGFSSQTYRRKPEHLVGFDGVVIGPTDGNLRGAAMLAQEGGRWIVTIAGYLRQYPPTDDEGFRGFLAGLPASDISKVVEDAESLSPPFRSTFPANVRYRYERLPRFPAGLLVMGDALCRLNPFSGQGITVCALQALAMQKLLEGGGGVDPREFFAAAAEVIDNPWQLTVEEDKHMVGAAVRPTLRGRWLKWYMDRFHVAARSDRHVAIAYLMAADLHRPAASILRPEYLWRVLVASAWLRAKDAFAR